ncbi:hypothetical protein [Paenibacillus sp. 2003]|uniref:CdiA C-terminal domain-containing protein n=1 Tax=Paenibacillus TaxID=44249 RepID=UPI00286AAE16|nr:hypothetical protein [Paenibacillus sp. 2003]
MLPEVKGGNGYGIKSASNPDFLINGQAFDCFSPKENTSARNIWSTVKNKSETQAERIVINLNDHKGSIEDLKQQFNEYKVDTLKEVLIIKEGKISRLVP